MRPTIELGRATRWIGFALLVTLAFGAAPQPADANPTPMAGVQVAPAFATKFTSPMGIASDGASLFVIEQRGVVHRVVGGKPTPYLTLKGPVAASQQGGLLDVAFHPQFASNGRLFVSYSAPGAGGKGFELRVSEIQGNATACNPATERVLMSIPKKRNLHNAGGLAFGPDGMLYLSVGDNAAKAPAEQMLAQRATSLIGKILRMDVSTPGKAKPAAGNPWIAQTGSNTMPWIWGFGFRNPWRFCWDKQGRMWTCEPGESGPTSREWIKQVVPCGGGKIHNHMWPFFEGTRDRKKVTNEKPNGTPVWPAFEYVNTTGQGAAVCGQFYDGNLIPALKGKFVFCDFARGQVYALDLSSGKGTGWMLLGSVEGACGVTAGPDKELYVTSNTSGVIYAITAK